VGSRRPTLEWTNSQGRYTTATFTYELEFYRVNQLIQTVLVSQGTGNTSQFTVENDLDYDTTYRWRVRARLGASAFGPWSATADFLAPQAPAAAAPPPVATGELPFAIPSACAQGNGPACIVAMTAVSPYWGGCSGGSGVECHRFVRTVAAALAANDPAWGLLSKNPGDTQCSWNSCSIRDGSGYGEDVIAYNRGGLRAWDVISGAGGPGASVNWAEITTFRPGNVWVPVPLPLGTR
jgi:hypothetical protein